MIAIGSDHGGYGLKQEIIGYLEKSGIEYKDYGTYTCLLYTSPSPRDTR